MEQIIRSVDRGSPADRAGVRAGLDLNAAATMPIESPG